MRAQRNGFTGLAIAGVLLLGAAACGSGSNGEGADPGGTGGFSQCEKAPNTCNGGRARQGGSLSFAIEKDIQQWDPNTSTGNVFETALVLNSVLPQVFKPLPDFRLALNKDLMESAELKDPRTIVYKVSPRAVWHDGTPIGAKDFEFMWRTMNGRSCRVQENGDSVDKCDPSSTGGYEQITSVRGSDGGKTVTVKLGRPYTDWPGLFGGGSTFIFPAHIAAKQGDIGTPEGLAKAVDYFGRTVPTYSGGPYKIDKFSKGDSVSLSPNPRWYGSAKPALGTLVFRIITDAAQGPTALSNKEIQGWYPQPQVDLVNQVSQIPNVMYNIGTGFQWEHYDFNLRPNREQGNPLEDRALRQALFTAVDRQAVIDRTVGQFTKGLRPMNNRNFVPQQEGYADTVTWSGQGTGNVARAKQILTQAGYELSGEQLLDPKGKPVRPLRMSYTSGNQIRQTECELFAETARQLGVKVNVEPTDDLGGVLSSGDYDVIVFAWIGAPTVFNGAQQLWLSDSLSNFAGYKNAEADKLINRAASSTDITKATNDLNQADRLWTEAAVVLPLYQKPTFLAITRDYVNVRPNNTNIGPTYNVSEWGLKAQ